MAVDGRGNVYFIQGTDGSVYKVSAGRITRFAGAVPYYTGSLDEGIPATSASLETPDSLAVDRQGNVYIAVGVVRKVSPSGTITTFAGQGGKAGGPCSSGDGGPATSAKLCFPEGLAVDGKGSVYIAEGSGHRVRKVSRDRTITTIAGTGKPGFSGDGGPATRARLNGPGSVAVDSTGNVYFCDVLNRRVRKVSRNGTITTLVPRGCSAGEVGNALAVDRKGNVYLADGDVYRITPGGKLTTFVGAPSLVLDGRRGQVKPGELAAATVTYGRGTLFLGAHERIFKATVR